MDNPENAALKEWVNESANFEKWDGLKMEFIHQHNPELHVEGQHATDLNGYTGQRLEKLLRERGFEEL